MNENLNLVEILKDCPEGTKLYTPIYGDVELAKVFQEDDIIYPIRIKLNNNSTDDFTRILYNDNCIPYNDDTKHLVGTTDEAPEFYRYWED